MTRGGPGEGDDESGHPGVERGQGTGGEHRGREAPEGMGHEAGHGAEAERDSPQEERRRARVTMIVVRRAAKRMRSTWARPLVPEHVVLGARHLRRRVSQRGLHRAHRERERPLGQYGGVRVHAEIVVRPQDRRRRKVDVLVHGVRLVARGGHGRRAWTPAMTRARASGRWRFKPISRAPWPRPRARPSRRGSRPPASSASRASGPRRGGSGGGTAVRSLERALRVVAEHARDVDGGEEEIADLLTDARVRGASGGQRLLQLAHLFLELSQGARGIRPLEATRETFVVIW